jgi:hypothetical protein
VFGHCTKGFEDKNGDQSCPNLNHDRIGAGANEGFDVQQLLDLPKKDFDLPTGFI